MKIFKISSNFNKFFSKHNYISYLFKIFYVYKKLKIIKVF